MSEKNCTNCAKATERRTATGHTGWRCVPNGMDVNARMCCEEWEERTTATARPVYAVSVTSISTEKIRRH